MLRQQNPSRNHGWVGRQTTHLNGIDSITRLGEGVSETMPVTGGAALRGSALVLEDWAHILEDWAQIPEDWLQILEDWAQILEDWLQILEDWAEILESWPQIVEDWAQMPEDSPESSRYGQSRIMPRWGTENKIRV